MPVFIHGALMDQIKDQLTYVAQRVKLNTATGYTDINKDAENFFCGLLNTAFGWKLQNLNALQMDFPAIDLGEPGGGICVQVTSTEGRDKVNRTLKKFFDHKLHTKQGYSRLIVLIIGDKPSYRDPFPVEDGFHFDSCRDIWGTKELVQQIDSLDLDTVQAVARYLETHLQIPQAAKPLLRLPFSALGDDSFVGRKDMLEELAERVRRGGNDPIVVSGLGGMGKTTLVTRFCADYGPEKVCFVRFLGSFTRTVAEGVAAGIAGYENREPDAQRDYAQAMELLSRLDSSHLLVIDNADAPDDDFGQLLTDPAWSALRKLKLRMILTTRCDVAGAVQVRKMDNETLYDFFRQQDLALSDDQMDDLIRAVHGHTMTVELIARTLKRTRTLTAEKLLAALGEGKLKEQKYRSVDLERNGLVEHQEIYQHLRNLFNVADISEDARAVLRDMVLLPDSGMDLEILEKALDADTFEALNQQIDHGWLTYNQDSRFVTMHPVICMVCRTELQPSDERCGEFLYAVWGYYDPKRYDTGQYRQFAELFSRAAELLPDENGDWAIRAGIFLKHLGHANNALIYDQQAVSRLEQSQPGSSKLATAYNNLGSTYGHLGDHQKALKFKLKALEIQEKVLPENHPSLATSYNNVGSTYGELGDHQKALKFMLKALEIWEKVLPENHPDLAASYNNVGSTYGELGDHQKALKFKLKALEIREKVLPENHPDLAASYNNAGSTYGKLGDHQKALKFKLKALEILEQALPPEHPHIKVTYGNIGVTYFQLGDQKKAFAYLLKSGFFDKPQE